MQRLNALSFELVKLTKARTFIMLFLFFVFFFFVFFFFFRAGKECGPPCEKKEGVLLPLWDKRREGPCCEEKETVPCVRRDGRWVPFPLFVRRSGGVVVVVLTCDLTNVSVHARQ